MPSYSEINNNSKLKIDKLYVKELSFKLLANPTIVLTKEFKEEVKQLLSAITINVTAQSIVEQKYEIVLQAAVPGEAKNLNLFLLEAQYAGLFTIAEPVVQLEHIIKNICVALIYPYLNQIITNVMVQAGLPVVILPPISSVGFNFATIKYEEPWFKQQYLKAVQLGNTEEVERLLRINQGLLNVLNEDGFTPVMVAIRNNREKTLQFLLSQDALLNVGNTSHQSIEVFAKACGNEIAAQLVHQAKIKCIDANSQLTKPLARDERNLVKNCGAAMLDYWLAWRLQAQEYSQAYQLIARQVPTLTFKVPTIYKFQNLPGESISFILKPTVPDRDCFFHAVGISGFNRDALVKKLVNNATPAIIAIFANEIRQFIYLGYAGCHQDEQENNACQQLLTVEIKQLFFDFQAAEAALTLKVVAARAELGEAETSGKHAPELLALLRQTNSNLVTEFASVYQEMLSTNEAIYKYCNQTTVFKRYVNLYLQEARGYMPFSRDFGVELATTTIDAINQLFQLKIQVYLAKKTNQTQLVLANQVQIGEIILIFHNGVDHFWGLVIVPPKNRVSTIDRITELNWQDMADKTEDIPLAQGVLNLEQTLAVNQAEQLPKTLKPKPKQAFGGMKRGFLLNKI